MIITKIAYNQKGRRTAGLFLILGSENGKIICIKDDFISKDESNVIPSHASKLKLLSLRDKVLWFKHNTPQCYKKGYRTISKEGTSIIEIIKRL